MKDVERYAARPAEAGRTTCITLALALCLMLFMGIGYGVSVRPTGALSVDRSVTGAIAPPAAK